MHINAQHDLKLIHSCLKCLCGDLILLNDVDDCPPTRDGISVHRIHQSLELKNKSCYILNKAQQTGGKQQSDRRQSAS